MNKKMKELNRINNELDKQVNDKNKEAFIDIICYLRGANISEYNQEIIRQDLLEMILSAQKRGESIQTVISEDYKVFCDNIITSLPSKGMKEKFLEFLDIVCGCMSILGAITIAFADETIIIIRNFATGKPLNFEISVSMGSVISVIIIIIAAFIIVEVIMKNSFEVGKKNVSKAKTFLIGAGIILVFLLIAWFGKTTLFTVNIIAACVVIAVLYIVHRILSRI